MLESLLPYFVPLTVLVYFVFTHFDGRRIKDEREEMIGLRAQSLVQKLTLAALTGSSIWVFLRPGVSAVYPLLIVVVAYMWGEIFSKLYYRRLM